MTKTVFSNISQLSGMIGRGAVTSRLAVRAHLEQILRNPQLNALAALNGDGAIESAGLLDAELKNGRWRGPLHGVPLTVKDFYNTAGIPTKCGSRRLADNVPANDAYAVQRLIEAGAVILGKTALCPFGRTYDSYDENTGHPNNPWDIKCTTGGSSGGSAAAVAAGLSMGDLAADCGGSGRLPPHFTGVCGIKPTGGLISLAGIRDSIRPVARPQEWNFFGKWAAVSPIARTVDDLRILLRALVSATEEETGGKELKEMRLAYSSSLGDVPVSRDTSVQFERLIGSLESAGAVVDELPQSRLGIEEAQEAACSLLAGYMSYSADPFTRYVRQSLLPLLPVPGGAGRGIRQGLFKGTSISAEKKGFESLMEKRENFIASLDSLLVEYDAWLTPVFPVEAFAHMPRMKHGAWNDPFSPRIDIDGTMVSWLVAALAYNILFNFSGHPAVSLPAMSSSSGLPMGVQVIGARGGDFALLQVCEEIEQAAGGFRRTPGY